MDFSQDIANIAYLIASLMFVVGLKGLTHPRTAVRGNLTSACAMLIAVVATLWGAGIVSSWMIWVGMLIGGAIGVYMAKTVPMTGMPEMVALFNGFGGWASFFVAGGALLVSIQAAGTVGEGETAANMQENIATSLSGWIGSVTLFGSLIAVLKLQEKVKSITVRGKKIWFSDSLLLPNRNLINLGVFLLTMIFLVLSVRYPDSIGYYWTLVFISAILGILITIPIGGADMPVVIALLNSYSGLAASATGFVISNNVLIIAGALVGASGLILTRIMCVAMNRSLANVIFATIGEGVKGPSADDVYAGKVKSTSAEEVAMLLDTAQRVVIVPGYGMAVSQAQHAVRDLADLLESRGTKVEFAIHPVAGRMPGHMNVLLAEANIDYDKLLEMDQINPTLGTVDVALVVGANDVVNPIAREPNSAIAGMPIIDVDKCRTVVVIKRSLSPGFAGIPNPLFAADNTLMYFSDGKKAFMDLVAAVKEG